VINEKKSNMEKGANTLGLMMSCHVRWVHALTINGKGSPHTIFIFVDFFRLYGEVAVLSVAKKRLDRLVAKSDEVSFQRCSKTMALEPLTETLHKALAICVDEVVFNGEPPL